MWTTAMFSCVGTITDSPPIDEALPPRPLAVHVLHPLVEAPARPAGAARLARVRAVEAVREDVLRHVDLDPADVVDQLLEAPEVDGDDVVHRQTGEVADRAHGERGASD